MATVPSTDLDSAPALRVRAPDLRGLRLFETTVAELTASALFLCRWLLFAALGADQRQVIFGVEWVTVSGLLSGGVQRDVHAAIVGQNHHTQITEHLLPVGRS